MQTRPILVIDDDSQFCELVTAILEQADFGVLSAPDGLSGLELARTAQPAVIILDMMMPGIDGINTLQRLKRDSVLKHIPVIGITASPDFTYPEKAFGSGAKFFLVKPFPAARLRRMVELAADSAQRDSSMYRRRCHPRYPVEVPVQCSVRGHAGTTQIVVGHTGNVSLGGLLLSLPAHLLPGTVCRFQLGLPEGPLTAQGAVVWHTTQPMPEGRIQHGIQLRHFLDESGLLQYRSYLSRVAVGSAV